MLFQLGAVNHRMLKRRDSLQSFQRASFHVALEETTKRASFAAAVEIVDGGGDAASIDFLRVSWHTHLTRAASKLEMPPPHHSLAPQLALLRPTPDTEEDLGDALPLMFRQITDPGQQSSLPSPPDTVVLDFFSDIVSEPELSTDTTVSRFRIPTSRSELKVTIRGSQVSLKIADLESLRTMKSSLRRLHSAVVEAEFYCQICLCNEKMTECWTLPCGHQFCKDCIAQYLTVKIKDANIINFKCPFIDDSLMNASGNGWNCAQCTFWNEGAVEPGAFASCSLCDTRQEAPPAVEPGCITIFRPFPNLPCTSFIFSFSKEVSSFSIFRRI
jgi:hypothetical protein